MSDHADADTIIAGAEPGGYRWLGLPARLWSSAVIVLAIGVAAPLMEAAFRASSEGRAFFDVVRLGIVDLAAGFVFAILVVGLHEAWSAAIRRAWPRGGSVALRYAAQLSGVLAVGPAVAFAYVWVYGTFVLGFGFALEPAVNYALTAILIPIAVTGVSEAFGFRAEVEAERLRRERALRAAAVARYDALKNRLAPHFLFNSLGALANAAAENPERVEGLVRALSDVYRYVLSTEGRDAATLEEEWAAAAALMRVYAERRPGAVKLTANISGRERRRVVPLSVLTMLENALKHNVGSDAEPLRIDVTANDQGVTVSNDVRPALGAESSGIGLENVDQQCRLAGAGGLRVREADGAFVVTVPYLPGDAR
jgi:hypothetical protein